VSEETNASMHNNLNRYLVETGLITGTAAAVSGSLAAAVTTPADVVKTMVMLGAREVPYNKSNKKSVRVIVREVLRESRSRGLFRGGGLRAAWAALGSGLYLGSYEVSKVWLKHHSSLS